MNKDGIRTELLCLDDSKTKDNTRSVPNSTSPLLKYMEKLSPMEILRERFFYSITTIMYSLRIHLSYEIRIRLVESLKAITRGAADDEGELITHMKVCEYFLKITGNVPYNVKFLVGGEVEIGSDNRKIPYFL